MYLKQIKISGNINDINASNSLKSFCTGVPDKSRRCPALISFRLMKREDVETFKQCASSIIKYSNFCLYRNVLSSLPESLSKIEKVLKRISNLLPSISFRRVYLKFARSCWLPWYVATTNEGQNRRNSFCQFANVLAGTTIRWIFFFADDSDCSNIVEMIRASKFCWQI